MISKLVNSQFNKVIKFSCLAENLKNDKIFHNKLRLSQINKGKQTYCGEMSCGITTFILGNILKQHIPIELHLYEIGYGKYKEDHAFLKSQDIIIDPTYRQFFNDNRNDGFSKYNNYLYNNLPPFFVGTEKDLYLMFSKLKELNQNEFNYNIIENDILNNWYSKHDITYKLNNFDIIYNQNYVKKLIYNE